MQIDSPKKTHRKKTVPRREPIPPQFEHSQPALPPGRPGVGGSRQNTKKPAEFEREFGQTKELLANWEFLTLSVRSALPDRPLKTLRALQSTSWWPESWGSSGWCSSSRLAIADDHQKLRQRISPAVRSRPSLSCQKSEIVSPM
jgi:hypothetical protein